MTNQDKPPSSTGTPCAVCGMHPWVYLCTPGRCMNPDPRYASRFYVVGEAIGIGTYVGLDARGKLAPSRIGTVPMGVSSVDAVVGAIVAIQNGNARAVTDEEKAVTAAAGPAPGDRMVWPEQGEVVVVEPASEPSAWCATCRPLIARAAETAVPFVFESLCDACKRIVLAAGVNTPPFKWLADMPSLKDYGIGKPPVEHPGPWRWDEYFHLNDANGRFISEGNPADPPSPRVRALTELAPEMEALLREMVRRSATYHFMPNIVQEAEALLALIDKRSKGGR